MKLQSGSPRHLARERALAYQAIMPGGNNFPALARAWLYTCFRTHRSSLSHQW